MLLNYLKKAIKFDKFSALYFDQNKDSNKIAVAKEEGLAEGLEKGEHNAKIKTAKNFLKMGLSIEQVAIGTGLIIDEVKLL